MVGDRHGIACLKSLRAFLNGSRENPWVETACGIVLAFLKADDGIDGGVFHRNEFLQKYENEQDFLIFATQKN